MVALASSPAQHLGSKATKPDRKRRLHRLRRHAHVGDLEVFPLMIENVVARQRAPYEPHYFEGSTEALRGLHAKALEFTGNGCAAAHEVHTAVRLHVELGDVLRQAERVVERRQEHAGAKSDARGAPGHSGQSYERRGVPLILEEVVLAEPDEVVARLLGHDNAVEVVLVDVLERARIAGLPNQGVADANVHRRFLSERITPAAWTGWT